MNPADYDVFHTTEITGDAILDPDPNNDAYFSPKGLIISADTGWQVTVTYRYNASGLAENYASIWCYSLNAAVDLNASRQDTLYNDTNGIAGALTCTFVLSHGYEQYTAATKPPELRGAAESRVLFDVYGADVLDVTWTEVDKFTGLRVGAPVGLDETPTWRDAVPPTQNNPGYPYPFAAEFDNNYSMSCRVYDDVVLAVWCHQDAEEGYSHLHAGGHTAYECRAVRYVEGTPPTLATGPLCVGPKNNELPGWAVGSSGQPGQYPTHDLGNPWSREPGSNYRLMETHRLGDGYAYIQAGETAYGQNVLGYVVQVDPTTLNVTFVRSVHSDSYNWVSDEWNWPPCPGPERALTKLDLAYQYYPGSTWGTFEGFYGADANGYNGKDEVLISLGPTGEELGRRYVPSRPLGITSDNPAYYNVFCWSNVMCMVDLGDRFISLVIIEGDVPGSTPSQPSPTNMVCVFEHGIDQGCLPAEDPTLLCSIPRYVGPNGNPYAWDFDAVYACAMPNGLIYVVEGQNSIYYSARCWVIDPVAKTFTMMGYTQQTLSGYSGHTWDWISIEPIDANRALVALMGAWTYGGLYTMIFDGTVDPTQRSPFEQTNFQPMTWKQDNNYFRNRDYYSCDSAGAHYLGNGRCIAIAQFSENTDSAPLPVSAASPGSMDQTWAVPFRLWEPNAAIDGGLIDTGRRFVG